MRASLISSMSSRLSARRFETIAETEPPNKAPIKERVGTSHSKLLTSFLSKSVGGPGPSLDVAALLLDGWNFLEYFAET